MPATALAPGYGLATTNTHGNTTWLADHVLGYDAADRHLTTATDDGTTVTYTRDATDRIVARTAKSSEGQTTVVRYGHTGGSDTADLTLTGSNGLVERVLALPGGVVLTDRPDGQADVWAYPNIHGDVIVTADPTGTRQGPVTAYDPFGQPVDPTTGAIATTTGDDAVPDTITGELDNGWLGQDQRPYEHAGTLATIEMGARQYVPTLGRFLQVDPIEGGTDNDYTYVTDPINEFDLDGMINWRKVVKWSSYAAIGVCVIASAGACAVAAGAAFTASAALRTTSFVKNKEYRSGMGWARYGTGLAADGISARLPGVRAAKFAPLAKHAAKRRHVVRSVRKTVPIRRALATPLRLGPAGGARRRCYVG